MAYGIKFAALFGLVALAAACGSREEEVVVVEPEPVTQEPVYTGKYN